MSTDQEIYKCHDCRCWDDGKTFPEGEYVIHTVANGMTVNFGIGPSVPLYTNMVLCPKHSVDVDPGDVKGKHKCINMIHITVQNESAKHKTAMNTVRRDINKLHEVTRQYKNTGRLTPSLDTWWTEYKIKHPRRP